MSERDLSTRIPAVHAFGEQGGHFMEAWAVYAIVEEMVECDFRASLAHDLKLVRAYSEPVDLASDPVGFRLWSYPSHADRRIKVAAPD